MFVIKIKKNNREMKSIDFFFFLSDIPYMKALIYKLVAKFLLCSYIKYIIVLGIYYIYIYMEQYIISIKENIICQDSNDMFNYRIKFKFN